MGKSQEQRDLNQPVQVESILSPPSSQEAEASPTNKMNKKRKREDFHNSDMDDIIDEEGGAGMRDVSREGPNSESIPRMRKKARAAPALDADFLLSLAPSTALTLHDAEQGTETSQTVARTDASATKVKHKQSNTDALSLSQGSTKQQKHQGSAPAVPPLTQGGVNQQLFIDLSQESDDETQLPPPAPATTTALPPLPAAALSNYAPAPSHNDGVATDAAITTSNTCGFSLSTASNSPPSPASVLPASNTSSAANIGDPQPTSDHCIICKSSLAGMGYYERANHVNTCIDAMMNESRPSSSVLDHSFGGSSEGSEDNSFEGDFCYCPVCGKDITHFTPQRRQQHTERCCDAAQIEVRLQRRAMAESGGEASSANSSGDISNASVSASHDTTPSGTAENSITGATYYCSICDKNLSHLTVTKRIYHFKNCAKKHNVRLGALRDRVEANIAKRRARETAAATATTATTTTSTRKSASKRSKTSRTKLVKSKFFESDEAATAAGGTPDYVSTIARFKLKQRRTSRASKHRDTNEEHSDEENYQLAIAMSASLAEHTAMHSSDSHLAPTHSDPRPPAASASSKRKVDLAGFAPLPSSQERKRHFTEQITTALFPSLCQSERTATNGAANEHEVESTPKLPDSKLAQKKSKRSCNDTVTTTAITTAAAPRSRLSRLSTTRTSLWLPASQERLNKKEEGETSMDNSTNNATTTASMSTEESSRGLNPSTQSKDPSEPMALSDEDNGDDGIRSQPEDESSPALGNCENTLEMAVDDGDVSHPPFEEAFTPGEPLSPPPTPTPLPPSPAPPIFAESPLEQRPAYAKDNSPTNHTERPNQSLPATSAASVAMPPPPPRSIASAGQSATNDAASHEARVILLEYQRACGILRRQFEARVLELKKEFFAEIGRLAVEKDAKLRSLHTKQQQLGGARRENPITSVQHVDVVDEEDTFLSSTQQAVEAEATAFTESLAQSVPTCDIARLPSNASLPMSSPYTPSPSLIANTTPSSNAITGRPLLLDDDSILTDPFVRSPALSPITAMRPLRAAARPAAPLSSSAAQTQSTVGRNVTAEVASKGREKENKPPFDTMSAEALRAELSRYGVRRGSKKFMIEQLNKIWEETHGTRAGEQVDTSLDQSEILHSLTPSKLPFGKPGSEGGGAITTAEKKWDSELEAKVTECIRQHTTLYEKILQYQPVDLVDTQALLKAAGVKCNRRFLAEYFDRNGVVYNLPHSGKGHQQK